MNVLRFSTVYKSGCSNTTPCFINCAETEYIHILNTLHISYITAVSLKAEVIFLYFTDMPPNGIFKPCSCGLIYSAFCSTTKFLQ